jgi:Dolichyl-phosphate-mannose-protein mannosyltransferase
MERIAVGLAITAVAIGIARWAAIPTVAAMVQRIESALRTQAMAAATGIVTAAIVWWCWGSLRQVPYAQDERAYVLQAGIFATRHWTALAPPLPWFFEQMHVLVSPAVAAKYPPGHALILAIGAGLGLPGLGPLALSAIAGTLVFVIARRLAGPWVAVMTWFIWVTEGANIVWRASYFSETTTAALWLLGWWALLEWRHRHQWWTMASLGAVAGWGAITRPLTMLVFAVPVAGIVLVDVYRRRAWRDIVPGVVAAAVCLAIIPLWSAHTTGDWRLTPLAQYTRDYMPWDRPGFGLDSTPPLQALPPDLQGLAGSFVTMHRAYSGHAVAFALAARIVDVAREFFQGWRAVLVVFVIVGLTGITADAVVGLTTAGLLILAYLTYAHPREWTLYYLELLPVPAYIAARGIWKCVTRGAPTRAGVAVVLLLGAAASYAVAGLEAARETRISRTSYAQDFNRRLDGLDSGKVLIFVRYGPRHVLHFSLVGNVPDRGAARAWIAYHRGDEDRQLMSRAPGRSAYLYDDETRTFSPLPDHGTPVQTATP